MHSENTKNKHFDQNTLRALFAWRGSYYYWAKEGGNVDGGAYYNRRMPSLVMLVYYLHVWKRST